MVAIKKQTVTIANGQTESGQIDATNGAAFGLQLPAAFTGTAISFQVSADGSTFQPLDEYDPVANDGSVRPAGLSGLAAGRSVSLAAIDLTPWRLFKIVSGTAEGAARTLIISGKAP